MAMLNANNNSDAPPVPGTAVKYGNGELETIERLLVVDIDHYEVQVPPDNCCTTTLIGACGPALFIVEDGHTVSFSKTHTIIEKTKRGAICCATREHQTLESGRCP